MDTVDLIVAKRDEIKRICAKHRAISVRVYGSCARDDYTDDSDIDFLVEIEQTMEGSWNGYTAVAEMSTELTTLLGRKADVWTPQMLRRKVLNRAMEEGVLL